MGFNSGFKGLICLASFPGIITHSRERYMDDILTHENKKLYLRYEVCFKVRLIHHIMTRIALR